MIDATADDLPAAPLADPMLRLALVASLVLLLAAFASLLWTPHPVERPDLAAQFAPPGASHLLGTDAQGRDLLSLVMKGMLTSYVVAGVGIAIGLLVGVPLGLVAAWVGGPAAWLMERVADYLATLPALVVATLVAVASGPGAASAMLAIGVAAIPAFARLTHRAASHLVAHDSVAAARLAGLGIAEAAGRHVVPALRDLLRARAAGMLGLAIAAEAALSYTGLSAQPGTASLGGMLREGQPYLVFAPLLAIAPGLAIGVMAGLLHLIADRLGTRTDPRLDGERQHGAA